MSTTINATSSATLVAILIAAHSSGDRTLERHARRKLEREHYMKVSFTKPRVDTAGGGNGTPRRASQVAADTGEVPR